MPISPSDAKLRLSGGASNSNLLTSLGGPVSSVDVNGVIFDDVTAVQAAAGSVEFRCLYVKNIDASRAMINAVAWINANTPNALTTIDIGLGTSPLNGFEQATASEAVVPTGVVFFPAVNKAGGINLGNIPVGNTRAIWLRRTVSPGAAATLSDTFQLAVEFESED